MVNVKLYSFTKKTNSTKRPTGGTSVQCLINSPSGVVTPSLTISGINGPDYNYCYIPTFGRYYWIREWTWNLGDWIASCEVDVLATYKTQIGVSDQYVLRSESEYDGNVIDTFYPGTGDIYTNSNAKDSPFQNSLSSSGMYVIGIINKGSAYLKYGAVSYYAMSQSGLTGLMNKLLTPGTYTEEIDKTLFNPLQYVSTCVWFPFSAPPVTMTSLEFGWWTINDIEASNQLPVYSYSDTFTVQKHPQSGARGNYMNLEPYSQYSFEWRPFGSIPIDGALLSGISQLSYEMNIDMVTGIGTLDLYTGSGATYYHISQTETQIGVPVQLSQINVDKIAQTQAVVGGVANLLTSTSPEGMISSLVSGIADFARASSPQLHSTGSNGSRSLYAATHVDNKPRLQSKHIMTTDQNPLTWGKPLCKIRTINELSDFILCADVELGLAGTQEENDQVKAYMEGGFHYE